MNFDKLKNPKELLRVALFGIIVVMIYGFLVNMIPAIFGLGFGAGGFNFTLGAILSVMVGVFGAELILDQINL